MGEAPFDPTTRASGSGQSRDQPSHLCQACLSVLTQDGLELEKLYPHHKDVKAFVEASRMGCYICSWLWANFPADVQEGLELLAEGEMPDDTVVQESRTEDRLTPDTRGRTLHYIQDHTMGMLDEGELGVSFTNLKIDESFRMSSIIRIRLNPLYDGYFPWTTRAYDGWLSNIWVSISQGMDDLRNHPWIITQQDNIDFGLITSGLPPNTKSMETWATVEGWIQKCSKEHSCLPKTRPDWYPTRLVEIMPNESVRIIRSDSELFQAKGRYITLSHRWGDGEFVKLTRDKLSTFESGLPVKMLRKTFQDAVVVAQRMNVPYMWIDSLCIIQDDDSDWQRESITMAEVYSNSFCNISADWGDESNGLFFEKRAIFELPYNLHLPWLSLQTFVEPGSPGLPPDAGLCHIIRDSGWSENVMKSPLNRRGWVFQERLLAPRVLHFSPEGVSWECGQRIAWERTPLGFNRSRHHATSLGLHYTADTCGEMKRLNLHKADMEVIWPELVRDYTSCGFTKQSDRLVAIAGIAKALVAVVGDQYVAGIWRKSLPEALGWKRIRDRRCGPVTQYYTPSFSWAAAEGDVEYPSGSRGSKAISSATFVKHRKKPLASPLDSTLRAGLWGQVLTQHVFGPMSSPEVEVRIQGMLRSCRRVPLQVVPFDKRADHYHCPSTGIEDPSTDSCFENGTVFPVAHDRGGDVNTEADTSIYYYTVISYTLPVIQRGKDAPADRLVQGILLKSVDASMGRFERIGHIANMQHYGHRNGHVPDIRLPLGNERELPAWSYDERTGQHIFFIV